MRNDLVKAIAAGGVLAGVSIVIMCLGGLIPVATYVCTMLCTVLTFCMRSLYGDRIGWTWFSVVSFLSLLLAPDKEAAAVFCCIGYYPMVKPQLERSKLAFVWKLILFNGVVLLLYGLLLKLIGLDLGTEIVPELGFAGLALLLLLGNVTFILLDRLLTKLSAKFKSC